MRIVLLCAIVALTHPSSATYHDDVANLYGSAKNAPSVLALQANGTAIPLWTSTPPGDHAGAIPSETQSCLTHGVPVSKCTDLSVTDVTQPTITPYLVPGADSAVIVSPGGGYGMLAINREATLTLRRTSTPRSHKSRSVTRRVTLLRSPRVPTSQHGLTPSASRPSCSNTAFLLASG